MKVKSQVCILPSFLLTRRVLSLLFFLFDRSALFLPSTKNETCPHEPNNIASNTVKQAWVGAPIVSGYPWRINNGSASCSWGGTRNNDEERASFCHRRTVAQKGVLSTSNRHRRPPRSLPSNY